MRIAGLLAELDAAGPDERRLPLTLLSKVLAYARRKRRSVGDRRPEAGWSKAFDEGFSRLCSRCCRT